MSLRHRASCRAFTIVELLAVVAIIGILVSMMLPAIQAARETAHRLQCANNLKQIGLAAQSYHAAFNVFPPAAFCQTNTAERKGSILLRLLPYMEQDTIYSQINFNQADTDTSLATSIGATVLPVYQCPSDSHDGYAVAGSDPRQAISNYAASRGPTTGALGKTPCSACPRQWDSYSLANEEDDGSGSPPPVQERSAGAFNRWGVCFSHTDIRDGESNTIFFGEVRPECSILVTTGWAMTENGNGMASTIVPLNTKTCQTSGSDTSQLWCNYHSDLGFRSKHPGCANFLFGDGSVTNLSDDIDQWTLQYLGGRTDAQSVQIPND